MNQDKNSEADGMNLEVDSKDEVMHIYVEFRVLTPAAIGLGIGVERVNGLDSVVKLWEFTPTFMSRLS